jgi:hypothetical protein
MTRARRHCDIACPLPPGLAALACTISVARQDSPKTARRLASRHQRESYCHSHACVRCQQRRFIPATTAHAFASLPPPAAHALTPLACCGPLLAATGHNRSGAPCLQSMGRRRGSRAANRSDQVACK